MFSHSAVSKWSYISTQLFIQFRLIVYQVSLKIASTIHTKLARIHDHILDGFDNDSDLILRACWNLVWAGKKTATTAEK